VFKHFYNLLTVSLLCLAFIGQSLATTVMSYEMLRNSSTHNVNNSNNNSDKMKNCMKHMADMNIGNDFMVNEQVISLDYKMTSKCCSDTCQCLVAGSTSTAILVQLPHAIIATEHAIKIQRSEAIFFNQIPSSLYRPPILTT
jgi:hypothetical protein